MDKTKNLFILTAIIGAVVIWMAYSSHKKNKTAVQA
jgi:hypothetical protein